MFLVNPEFWQRQVNELTDYQFHETIHRKLNNYLKIKFKNTKIGPKLKLNSRPV